MNIIERISQTEIAKSWRSQLMTTGTRQLITGLSGSAKTLLMAGALQKTHQKNCYCGPKPILCQSISR
ncbi:hypothetical protein EfsSVR2330_01960 [Enterococcus faecalis]|nr:hypothetical protein EfsSVR2330_01960 [Enterococcus faecalis]